MKKIIIVTLVLVMVFVNCGFTSPRAIDQEDLIWELEDEGFVRRGDVWTLEAYGEDDLEWIVAWYDMVDNHGVMTVYGRSDEYPKTVYISGCYNVEWDYEEAEFTVTDVIEIRR